MKRFKDPKRRALSDMQREFIYLDEVSVISLLAGLQGEIKDSVTETLARSEEHGFTTSVGIPNAGAQMESRFGSTRSSTSEVVRRAVIQSTFRELWRRDVGVLLHDISGVKSTQLEPIGAVDGLKKRLKKLRKSKLITPLSDIARGDIIEMDVRVEAHQFFTMVTVADTLLDLLEETRSCSALWRPGSRRSHLW